MTKKVKNIVERAKNQAKNINKNMSPTPMRSDTSCNNTHDVDIAMTPKSN